MAILAPEKLALRIIDTANDVLPCDVSPAIMINDKTYGDLTPDSVREIIKRYIREDV